MSITIISSQNPIFQMGLSSDQKYLVFLSSSELAACDLTTQEAFKTHHPDLLPQQFSISSAANTVVFGAGSSVGVWDLDRKDMHVLNTHQGTIHYTAFFSQGQKFVSGSSDGMIRIFETKSRQLLHTLKDQKGAVHLVEGSPQGSFLLSASKEDLSLWNGKTGSFLGCLENPTGQTATTEAVQFSPDESYAFLLQTPRFTQSFSDQPSISSSSLNIWNLREKQCVRSIDIAHPIFHMSLDQKIFLTPEGRQELCVWDLQQMERHPLYLSKYVDTCNQSSADTDLFNISPNQKNLVALSSDGTINSWDLSKKNPLLSIRLGFLPKLLCVNGESDPKIYAAHPAGHIVEYSTTPPPEPIAPLMLEETPKVKGFCCAVQ